MDVKEMIDLLKCGDIRVFDASQSEYFISHTCNNTIIYFWSGGYYNSFSNIEGQKTYDELVDRLSRIIRVEKRIDFEYYPI